jgi:hypothetical protein
MGLAAAVGAPCDRCSSPQLGEEPPGTPPGSSFLVWTSLRALRHPLAHDQHWWTGQQTEGSRDAAWAVQTVTGQSAERLLER